MQTQVSSRMASRVRLHNKAGICCANSLLGLIHPCLNISSDFSSQAEFILQVDFEI